MSENETGAQVVRHHLGTSPDTTLLLGDNAMDRIAGYRQWIGATGMDPRLVQRNTLCSAPLPVYVSDPAGPRQFSDVNPATLWHPLFWLPARLATPYTLTIPDPDTGEPIVEPDESWAIRLSLELSVSGLYDPTEGWVDLLHAGGIDISTQEGVDRVAAWQAGAPDDVLDNIDLSAYLDDPHDPDWADRNAAELLPAITDAHWALMAESILELLTQARSTQDFEQARQLTSVACNLAAAILEGSPVPEGAPPMGELFDKVRAAAQTWTRDRATFESGPMQTAVNWLSLLRNQMWPAVEAFDLQDQEA